jgi:hypothetical protein
LNLLILSSWNYLTHCNHVVLRWFSKFLRSGLSGVFAFSEFSASGATASEFMLRIRALLAPIVDGRRLGRAGWDFGQTSAIATDLEQTFTRPYHDWPCGHSSFGGQLQMEFTTVAANLEERR